MMTALSWSYNISACLDGAGTQKRFPMRLARRDGKGRGDRNHISFGTSIISKEGRKAQIIANRHPQMMGVDIRADRRIACFIAIRFAVGLAFRQGGFEQMDFVILCPRNAVSSKEAAAVCDFAVRAQYGQ